MLLVCFKGLVICHFWLYTVKIINLPIVGFDIQESKCSERFYFGYNKSEIFRIVAYISAQNTKNNWFVDIKKDARSK